MKTIIEPFRIKSVEPIRMTSREEREQLIREANYNLFSLKSEDVIIDLLTDSGTSAMSTNQWAALMQGDESYAGSPSFYRFEAAVRELMPFKHIIPTHQGRAAEYILTEVVAAGKSSGKIIPNNTHFDTTRANFENAGITAVDLVIKEGLDPALEHPFKGNMDLQRLEALLEEQAENIPMVEITITNNAGGGQPVSMANIRDTKALCERYGKQLIIDSARFAENAWFIKQREAGYENASIPEIVREMYSYADGMTMSGKKDTFANMGGWLALNDDAWAEEARNHLRYGMCGSGFEGDRGRGLPALPHSFHRIYHRETRCHRHPGDEAGWWPRRFHRCAPYVAAYFTPAVSRPGPGGGHVPGRRYPRCGNRHFHVWPPARWQ
jgi:tryptophanase